MDLGPKRDKVAGKWRRFHNEELHDFQPSPNFFRVIKSRSIRLAEHVVPMKERKGQKGIWRVNMREGEQLEDLGVRR
jgi:hypothetical protein